MAKGISNGGKIHKNRDKEFFNSIVGKYRVSENSLSFLPKLIYLETAHMISYIAGNRFFVNEKLNLMNHSIKKQEHNNYFNYTTKKVGMNNYNIYNYVNNNIRSSYSRQENDSPYTGTRVLTPTGVLNFVHLNNIMRRGFSESNGTAEIEGIRSMVSPKLSVINNAGRMVQRSNTMTAKHDSLAQVTKAKNRKINWNFKKETLSIGDRYFHGSDSENNSNNYSTVYRRNGIKANGGNTYSQGPELELAVNEVVRNKTKKSEAPSQNIVSEGTKEVNKQTPLDINKIVSQVYNELERKIRIERERRGL